MQRCLTLVGLAACLTALAACDPQRPQRTTPAAPPATSEAPTTASQAPAPVPGKGADVTEHKPDSGMVGGASGTVASGGKPGSGSTAGAGTGPAVSSGGQMPPPR